MDIVTSICSLIVIFYLFYICNNTYNYYNNNNTQFKKLLLSKQYHDIKAGDILLFKSFCHSLTTSILMGSFYSHVGIITEYNGEKYVIELDILNEVTKNNWSTGVNTSRLLERLDFYKGNIYYMPLKYPLTNIQKIKLNNIITKTKGKINYDQSKIHHILRLIFNHRLFYPDMICIEYISYILKYLKLINLYDMSSYQMVQQFMKLPKKQLTDNKYKSIKELIIDIGEYVI